VGFLQLPNGVWVVNRRHIRMPLLEEGGEVTEESAVRIELQGPSVRATVEGVVTRAATREPAPDLVVSLKERRTTLIGGRERGRLQFDDFRILVRSPDGAELL
jgi:hypothetical protein